MGLGGAGRSWKGLGGATGVCGHELWRGPLVCRENDVLRDQLKQYVTMIQTQEQQQTQPPQEDEEPPTPTEENSSGLGGASTMEEHMHGKLSEVSLAGLPPTALVG